MKYCIFLLLSLMIQLKDASANSLESLVFDISADSRAALPENGWLHFSFSVMNYDSTDIEIEFKATVIETGKELPFYPHGTSMIFKPGDEQKITIFMDAACGWKGQPLPGCYDRLVRYEFMDVKTKEKLVFEQPYKIDIKPADDFKESSQSISQKDNRISFTPR